MATKCVSCSNMAVNNKTRCEKCLKLAREAQARYRHKRKNTLMISGICIICGSSSAITGMQYCIACREKNIIAQRKSYYKHINSHKEYSRNRPKTPEYRRNCADAQARYRKKHPDRVIAYRERYKAIRNTKVRNNYAKLRDEVFSAYGGYRCVCCGETEPKFLTIDHINNDGAKHKKTKGVAGRLYWWLKEQRFPEGYQVLCINCNLGKHRNGGVCPHNEQSLYNYCEYTI